jgi:hypothetical protein
MVVLGTPAQWTRSPARLAAQRGRRLAVPARRQRGRAGWWAQPGHDADGMRIIDGDGEVAMLAVDARQPMAPTSAP